MPDDTRSITPANRACGQFLYIPNPGSDNSSDEEDKDRIQPLPDPSSSYPQSYVYQPPALPHMPPPTALQPRTHPNTHSPLELITNFTQDHPHPTPPSSQSTSNLSSASSSSSRAIDTTPPRSPGVRGRSPYIGFDASSGQGPYTGGFNMSKRNEGGRVSARPSTFLDKIKARIPHRQPRPSRTYTNHNQDLVSCPLRSYLVS
ncbi:hypothetical protein FIBSPDRAFT_163396 [Athelia psychrophila]|uniref:Uncharacterized protein n=1 Tax=Athelia psychrophila TaxID=1759441 RepID=A0A166SXZ0_9AGAM|nr:hypothetical protein FIBSPDRAFT_163396 [Fibularhizoctonia sp. CBS 109695]